MRMVDSDVLIDIQRGLPNAVAWFEDAFVELEAKRLDTLFARDRSQIGPLHGVPITVKDWIDVAGFPCAGDQSDADHSDAARRPSADASAVGRLRAAGAVVIAKTKAWGPEPPAAGVVLHPTHPERTPGGSSTGEAVAIASGGSLVGIGSDSGGSIRLPASWCGIIGFKPTSGLVPTTGHFPRVGERYDGRTQIGPLARTVDDIAALSAIMAGPDWRDAGVAPVAIPWNDAVPVRGISFAVVTGEDDAGGADDEVVAGVEGVASMLEAAGLRRTSWTAPWLAGGLELTRNRRTPAIYRHPPARCQRRTRNQNGPRRWSLLRDRPQRCPSSLPRPSIWVKHRASPRPCACLRGWGWVMR